jgi:hypothetical protein
MVASEYRHIRFEVESNGVATLTFNLPQMANAMDLLHVNRIAPKLEPLTRSQPRTCGNFRRPSIAVWFILKSSTTFTTWEMHQWGDTGDVPILRDRSVDCCAPGQSRAG